MDDDINNAIRQYIKHYINNVCSTIFYKNIEFRFYYYNWRLYVAAIINNNQMDVSVDNIFGFNIEYTEEEILVKQYLTDWYIKGYEKAEIGYE